MLFLSVPELQTGFLSKVSPLPSLYEILSEAFLNLCEAWLKQNGSPPEKYIFISMLCGRCNYICIIDALPNKLVEKWLFYIFAVTLSLTIAVRAGRVLKKTAKLWQKHLVEVR